MTNFRLDRDLRAFGATEVGASLRGVTAGRCLTSHGETPPWSVSVVISNYNHGRFLPRCLEAIATQLRLPDEVLLIDDASTDDSVEIATQFAHRLPEFRLIRHDVNTGVIATMNHGLAVARGSHVLFAAADDWIEPELLKASMNMIEAFPQAGLCSALTALATEAGESAGPFRTSLPLRAPGYITPAEACRLLIRDLPWFNGNTVIINREAVLACGGYRPELKAYADMFLNTELALRYGACFIPRFLAVWRRMNAGYAASLSGNPERLMAAFEAAMHLMTVANQCVFTSEYVRRWAGRWRYAAAHSMLAAPPPRRREGLSLMLSPRYRFLALSAERLARIPWIGVALAVALLFASLRPHDFGPVLWRKITWMLHGGRIERAAT